MWICCPRYVGVTDNEKMDKLASEASIQGTPRMDREEVARATLDRVKMKDNIG